MVGNQKKIARNVVLIKQKAFSQNEGQAFVDMLFI